VNKNNNKKSKKEKKEKNKLNKVSQMRLHEINSLLHNKCNNYWSEDTGSSTRGLIPRVYKEFKYQTPKY
jgi:hypothetical protein